MNQKENPINKSLMTKNNNLLKQNSINLSDMPDFIYPEKDNKILELFSYLTQKINLPYFSIDDIFIKHNNKNINFAEWKNEMERIEKEKRERIINNINKSSKIIIESVFDYMKFLNFYFYKFGEKVRSFIFLEYFLSKLEIDKYIVNTDEYCNLYNLYFNLCRDPENIFDYLEKNEILINNELFYCEKGYYYERIHKYKEANQTYIEGFIKLIDDNDKKGGKVLINQYLNFENRMLNRISRDLENLDEDWDSIDSYIHKKIKECKLNNVNIRNREKYFLMNEDNKNLENKLLENINYNFNLSKGRLILNENNNDDNKGTEVVDFYGNVKYIKNPPDINKVTNITFIYEILKISLSLIYSEWKIEYDNFDKEVKQNNEKLPYSWISNLRPTKRNIKNLKENNEILKLVQKEYINAGNLNTINEIKNNDEITEKNIKNINKEDKNENNHDISNMLSNIGIIFDKKEENNKDIENNNKPIINKEKLNYDLMGRDNKTILENIQYQMIHQSKNNGKDNNKKKEIKSVDKNKKNKKIKRNKFKCVGTLNFDKDGLMLINISNENDQKIDIMRSASKMINNNQKENEDRRREKKYTITLDNAPRRIKYIKEKTLKEKKLYEKRKKEMLQGLNFDYLNSFKKLFEIYPDLNNLLENDIINKNRNNKIEEYKLDLIKKDNNENMNIIGDTNIQLQNGPTNAMKLLLEAYGIPQNFLEENNKLIEYAKKNGIDNDFMFDNLFKDIKAYINEKNLKRKKSIFSYNENNMNNDKDNEVNENIDDDGDLIIESESEEEEKNNNCKEEKDVNKGNKHCSFDSKKNKEIVYLKNEDNEKDKDGIGKMIDDINRKAEKGIKIGEKTIFSNYKGIKEHSFNNNNYINNGEKNKIEYNNDSNIINENSLNRNSLIVNKELSNNKERKNEKDIIIKEEINRNNILINNSKISTDIFMNALNFCNNDKEKNNNKNANNVQNNNKDNSDYLAKINDSKINKKNINIFDEQKFTMNKEKQLNNIKENESNEKFKIEIIEKDNNTNKYNSNIGNIHDLDNFDDLFK